MTRAATTIVVIVLGAGALAGSLLWRARRASPPTALPVSAQTSQPSAAPAPASAPSDTSAPPTAAESDANRTQIATDVAARVAASMAASKAKADADKLDALNHPPPDLPLEDLIIRSLPAVVRVETREGLGTGFFIAPDTILTNVHVVGGNVSVTIRRMGGATQAARVETTAPELDIAIVRIANPSPDQATLVMGSATRARAGQEVIALGSPLGLQNTVTRGIVSAVRQVGPLTLVQTDAAINPGNSGGPLLDRSGQVIGITSLGMQSSLAQGLSFAIAIEHAQALLAGTRPAGATGTPLSTLNQAMTNTRPTSEAEQSREQASQVYERAVAVQARRADQLDDRWRSFVRGCYEGRVVGAFDRPWFALWDSRAMQGAVSPGCTGSFDDIRRVADNIRDTIVALEEAARQADVYPGTRRDILRRHRLDYVGWTR